jgi:molecular chaperone HscB
VKVFTTASAAAAVVNFCMTEKHSQSAPPSRPWLTVLEPPPAAGEACWSCGSMRAAHFCQSCGRVQPPHPVDYFTFFGLPRKLSLDVAALEKEFYQLSRKLHPDLFAVAEGEEQRWSLEKSSQLNDAYRTLKDPVSRTEYLLRLAGVEFQEQSKDATEKARASGSLKQQVVPPDLLEEVFELNMQLEELRAEKKLGEPDAELIHDLKKHEKHFEEKLRAVDHEMEHAWKEWDHLVTEAEHARSSSHEEWMRVRDKMVDILNRRSYVRNLVRDVKDAIE